MGIATKAMDIKTTKGEEVMIVFRNADRRNYSVITTSPDLTFNPNPPPTASAPPPPTTTAGVAPADELPPAVEEDLNVPALTVLGDKAPSIVDVPMEDAPPADDEAPKTSSGKFPDYVEYR